VRPGAVKQGMRRVCAGEGGAMGKNR